MALNAGTIWEVRTTGNANNGGGFFNRLPGTSVDYSQQNASVLSSNDLACVLATVVLTSVVGGFTAAMVGNLIQIRAGGVNFVAGFYEIVQWNSANSVNLDRTPVAAGNGTGGLGEVGGALISPETFILSGVSGNLCYVKSGNYNFAASRTYANLGTKIFGYDVARNIAPTGNNRPLFNLAAFFITTNVGIGLTLRNIRFTGTAAQLILGKGTAHIFINCRFENTNNAGTRRCIYFDTATIQQSFVMDCELLGTAGADSRGVEFAGSGPPPTAGGSLFIAFCFFHDLTYGHHVTNYDHNTCYFKNTFARIGANSIHSLGPLTDYLGIFAIFNSFYSAGTYHINSEKKWYTFVYGNTFDSAAVSALRDSTVSRFWHIENNDFWNNGASVINCFLDFDNIGLDPLWVNPGANDFNFGPGSPNIDQALGIRLGV